MTGPGHGPLEPADSDPGVTPASPASPAPRPGLGTFSLEGRNAPGLYLVGWLGSLVGVATIFVVVLAQPSDFAGAVLLGVGTLVLSVGLAAAAGSQAIERQARGSLAYRGPSPFLIFCCYVALSLFLELVAFVPLQALGVRAGTAVESLVGLVILNGSAVLLVAGLVVGSGALRWRDLGLPVRGPEGTSAAALGRNLFEGMILAIPILFITVGLGSLLIGLLGTSPAGPLPNPSSTSDAVLNLISGVLIAPLGEELFYRGFATTAWVRGMGARGGIIRGALLFSVAHVLTLSGSPADAVIAFATRLPVALALGWIFVRRGSLASSFGLHAMFNAIPLILVGLSFGA